MLAGAPGPDDSHQGRRRSTMPDDARPAHLVGTGSARGPGSSPYVCWDSPVRLLATKGEIMEGSAHDLAIETSGLVKTFGKVRALDGIDLAVTAGTVYGVLGPNGAGKTTTLKILATLLRPDSGTARVFGHDVVREADAVRGRVSLTGQYSSVDEDLTGTENLILLGRLLGHHKRAAGRRAAELMEAFGLTDAADRQVKKYSGG